MKQFVVPQFIDVEDKIIGPITTRQFIIMIVMGIVMFLEYKLSDITMFLVLGIPTFAIFGTVAFFKINGMPFHFFFLNVTQTLKRKPIRVWSREMAIISAEKKSKKKGEKEEVSLPVARRAVTSSSLSDLSLIIDTGGIYRGEDIQEDFSFKTEEDDEL